MKITSCWPLQAGGNLTGLSYRLPSGASQASGTTRSLYSCQAGNGVSIVEHQFDRWANVPGHGLCWADDGCGLRMVAGLHLCVSQHTARDGRGDFIAVHAAAVCVGTKRFPRARGRVSGRFVGLQIRVECVACQRGRPPNARYRCALRPGDDWPTAELAASEDDPDADLLRQIQSGETG